MSPVGIYFIEIIFSLRGYFPTGTMIFLYLLKIYGKVDFENLVCKFYHWPLHNYHVFRNATVLKLATRSSPGAKSGR